jgi:hypothetical protein
MREGRSENGEVSYSDSDTDTDTDEDAYTYEGLTGYGVYLVTYISSVGPIAVCENPDGEGLRYVEPDKTHPIWKEWRALQKRSLGRGALRHAVTISKNT